LSSQGVATAAHNRSERQSHFRLRKLTGFHLKAARNYLLKKQPLRKLRVQTRRTSPPSRVNNLKLRLNYFRTQELLSSGVVEGRWNWLFSYSQLTRKNYGQPA
jgi:hypothetical protein